MKQDFSITLFGEGDDEVANPDPNHPGTTTNPVDPSDNPGGEDPDNPGNIFGTGSVSISGANSFAAGEKYTAITNIADANMIGTVSYSWQASTDGGTNYNLITDANSESYTLALSDFFRCKLRQIRCIFCFRLCIPTWADFRSFIWQL